MDSSPCLEAASPAPRARRHKISGCFLPLALSVVVRLICISLQSASLSLYSLAATRLYCISSFIRRPTDCWDRIRRAALKLPPAFQSGPPTSTPSFPSIYLVHMRHAAFP